MDIDFSGKLNLGIRGLRFLWDSNWMAIDFHAIKLKSVIIFQKIRRCLIFLNKIVQK